MLKAHMKTTGLGVEETLGALDGGLTGTAKTTAPRPNLEQRLAYVTTHMTVHEHLTNYHDQ